MVKCFKEDRMAKSKTQSRRPLDIEAAFKFVFQDPDWVQKIAIGGLLSMTIIGIIPVLGWGIEIARRVLADERELLPDWRDWETYIVDGLKMMLILFLWMLPVMVIFFVATAGPVAALVLFAPANEGGEYLPPLLFVAFGLVSLPLGLALNLLMQSLIAVVMGVYADSKSVAKALAVGDVLRILRANFWPYIGLGVLLYVVAYAASVVGYLLCVIGVFFVIPVQFAITAHFAAQGYRNVVLLRST
jgi:hypothetical protein